MQHGVAMDSSKVIKPGGVKDKDPANILRVCFNVSHKERVYDNDNQRFLNLDCFALLGKTTGFSFLISSI